MGFSQTYSKSKLLPGLTTDFIDYLIEVAQCGNIVALNMLRFEETGLFADWRYYAECVEYVDEYYYFLDMESEERRNWEEYQKEVMEKLINN